MTTTETTAMESDVSSLHDIIGGEEIPGTYRYHTVPTSVALNRMKVRLVPALDNNYMYLLIDEATKQCAVIDPVEPQKILAAVEEEGATLSCIMTTHFHEDHADGNEELAELVEGIAVYGADDEIGALTHKVTDGFEIIVGSLIVRCVLTPCHTPAHICYYIPSEDTIFTGDTLFVGCVGQFFSGPPEQMHRNLFEVLGKLPGHTRVFCGHENTVANLKYAVYVEPDNESVKNKLSWAEAQRSKLMPTIPSTIAEEWTYNPFMRVGEASVQRHIGTSDPVHILAALREEKTTFRPN